MVQIRVLAGQRKELVGTVPAADGMLTNRGRIARVSGAGTVFFEDGTRARVAAGLTTRHTEARKHGYPYRDGCERYKQVLVKRGRKQIAA